MPQRVAVIGGGMVGLSTAWFLQVHGFRVTVDDRRHVAAGASPGNAGWLTRALTAPLPEPAGQFWMNAATRGAAPGPAPPTASHPWGPHHTAILRGRRTRHVGRRARTLTGKLLAYQMASGTAAPDLSPFAPLP
jgi:glycine/D-amino acid oxidase-like deaminating enzyme